jgi:hypothetical protein
LIKERERLSKGFNVKITWKREQLEIFKNGKNLIITLIGEWQGKKESEKIALLPSQTQISKCEFSSLSCIRCEEPSFMHEGDELNIRAIDKLVSRVPSPTNPTENLNDSNFSWKLTNKDFINLNIPEDYKIYWLGHTSLEDFYINFKKYFCYFIPLPGREDNQSGRLTPKIIEKLNALVRRREKYLKEGKDVQAPSFDELIEGQSFSGGLLISQMKGGVTAIGAACYIYPPQPGAFPESAIYILPSDLYRMDDI